jgi:hypothetical protein
MPALFSVRRRKTATWLTAGAAVCAGCGSSASTPLTGGGATQQAVATPPAGAVYGEIVDVRRMTLTVRSTERVDAHFDVSPPTRVTRIVTADASTITTGTCVLAGGRRDVEGPVVAVWVLVEGPTGCTPAGAGLEDDVPGLSLADGTVETATDRMLVLRGPDGEQRISLSIATAVGAVGNAGLGDLTVGRCVVGRGSGDRGGRLTAQRVTIVPAPTSGCFGGNGRVGVLSFLDPRSGVGAPGVGGGPGFIGAEGGGPGQGQTGVSFGGPVSAPTPAFPSSLPAPSSFGTPSKPAPLLTPTPTHSAAPPPPPPIFMPGPPARPPEASPTPSRRGIGPQPTPVPRPRPAP